MHFSFVLCLYPAVSEHPSDGDLFRSPSWFSVTMGVGIPCSLIHNLPYPSVIHLLRIPATVFLLVDLALFTLFTSIIIARYIRWPVRGCLLLARPGTPSLMPWSTSRAFGASPGPIRSTLFSLELILVRLFSLLSFLETILTDGDSLHK